MIDFSHRKDFQIATVAWGWFFSIFFCAPSSKMLILNPLSMLLIETIVSDQQDKKGYAKFIMRKKLLWPLWFAIVLTGFIAKHNPWVLELLS